MPKVEHKGVLISLTKSDYKLYKAGKLDLNKIARTAKKQSSKIGNFSQEEEPEKINFLDSGIEGTK